ncbi:MAG: Holliday junction resolvase RuvX [Bacteroidales bacterium]|jgi:putative Holliday junction resolvase|nr:Holliday junction resolvase RuvX [Bacteroidales bacterium]
MGRIIAFDYGTKRIGVAVTDTMQIIATHLRVMSDMDVIPFLKVYIEREDVDCFVVGEPKQMDNTPSQSAAAVHRFCNRLRKSFPDIDVFMVDERFTSKIASQTIAQGGLKKEKKRDKSLIDKISAVLILQSFMSMSKENRVKYYDTTNS